MSMPRTVASIPPHMLASGLISPAQECTHRKILHDDHHGRQRVEVDHKSDWKFLWHHGSFTTSLLVEQVGQMVVCACCYQPTSGQGE